LSNPTTLKTGLISQNQTVFFRTTEFLVLKCVITVGTRIVAGCGLQTFQATQKLKRAPTLEFTAVSAIIFVHCYALLLTQYQVFLPQSKFWFIQL
jgi:hypothetical protein